MKKFTASLATQFLRRLRQFVSIGSALMVAVALLVLAPLFTPAAALAADTSGNWNLDDGAGHRLGARFQWIPPNTMRAASIQSPAMASRCR